MRSTLFARLDAEWPTYVASRSTKDRFADWRDADPDLAEFADLDSLVRYAQTPGHPGPSDDALRCLARRSSRDAVAARALLQCVLYALPQIATAFRPAAAGDAEETASVVVAAAYDRIRTYPVERRPRHIAANIVLDTRQMVSRALCRPRAPEVLTDEPEVLVPAPCTSAVDEVLSVVEDAVRRGRVAPGDARIILLTRLLDVPAVELAREYGCLPHSLRRRRLRAELALVSSAK